MNNPKLFVGPMSKNTVDTVCSYAEEADVAIGLIPSRRQVEYDGGYSNNWKTKDFVDYVKNKSKKVQVQRDHGGPHQGSIVDDGTTSLTADCSAGVHLIHIDPWKQHVDLDAAASATARLIKHCISKNDTVRYEVGTEAAIRPYTCAELDIFLGTLKKSLGADFKRIRYVVIQGGTKILGNTNIGKFDSDRCGKMVSLAKEYELLTKEHNGDYLSRDEILHRFNAGVDAINIAPEFGFIETQTILNDIFNNFDEVSFDKFYSLCHETQKWRNWLPSDILDKSILVRKMAIVRASGHYVFSDEALIQIKKNYPDLDKKIRTNIKARIAEVLT